MTLGTMKAAQDIPVSAMENTDQGIGELFDEFVKGEVKGDDGRTYDRMNVKAVFLVPGETVDKVDELWGCIDSKEPYADHPCCLLYYRFS